MAGDPAPPDAPEDSSENLDNNQNQDSIMSSPRIEKAWICSKVWLKFYISDKNFLTKVKILGFLNLRLLIKFQDF